MFYSVLFKKKKKVCSFFKRNFQAKSSKIIYPCECVCCWIGALALLTQRRDLKFLKNILNLPILLLFCQILEIAVKEKKRFFVGTHLKAEYNPKSIFRFFYISESCFY